jgi:hypothetical protein
MLFSQKKNWRSEVTAERRFNYSAIKKSIMKIDESSEGGVILNGFSLQSDE